MAMVFLAYITWHYSVAPLDIIVIGRNYIVSAGQRFSIARHLSTLFSPWHRMSAATPGIDRPFGTRVSDAFMEPILRSIGAVIRLFTVCVGLVVQASTVVLAVCALAIWLAWPFIALASMGWGLSLLTH